ncbi:hypothetical protein CE557_191 [Cardinium endosymbiont of Sogatella furcifera]|nr:hypothetical protein CE557_191 [Cardinium endosymbiont of Sogatella furcifera]
MSHRINMQRLTLLLSKSLFYIFIPVSLMAMHADDPPGPDPYNPRYNILTQDYNAANLGTDQILNDYNDGLLAAINSIANGAERAHNWADHHHGLAQIDLDKALLIFDRVNGLAGAIDRFAIAAKARIRAGQAQPNDQNILDASNQARNIRQQAEAAVDRAQAAAGQAENAMQAANNSHQHILQIINGMNEPILNIDYNMNDVQGYYAQNNGIRGALADFNQANRSACTARDSAIQVHNGVNNLDQLMLNIVQQCNNIGIRALP